MNYSTLLTFAAIICGCAAAPQLPISELSEDYCYSNDTVRTQKLLFATKTAYQFAKGTAYVKLSVIPKCEPVKFWLFSRHGTRLPEKDVIQTMGDLVQRRDEILKKYADGKTTPIAGGLCAKDLELLRNWVLDKNITEDHEQYLVEQGWNDLRLLAKDYQKVYPKLLLNKYDPEHFLFRHTNIQRTEASYKAFAEGLFGEGAYNNITLDPIPEKDLLLEPHNNCDLFDKQGAESKQPESEVYKFKNSEILNQTLANVSARLGYETPLSYDDVSLMYDMCRFEQAWFLDKPSAWCTAFTMNDVKVLEYFEDMKHEYKTGHVGKLNENVPCALMQDMLKQLNSDDKPLVTAYFSHSTLMHLFFVAFGAYKDKDLLRADNYEAMDERKWRTSFLVPFASNMAAVKYNCSEGDSAAPTTKVRFFLNQNPLDLDWCNEGLCEFKDVLAKYDKYIKADCPNEYCKETNSGNLIRRSVFMIVSVIIYSISHLF